MTGPQDLIWWSKDGLRLHARDYPGDERALPVLCMPGLTRNARDYESLAARLSGARRVIAIDFRGRGESAYAKDPMSYVPLTYAQDVTALLDEAGIDRFVSIGTSLGGIVTMLLAAMLPGRIAGALFNDVGPEIEPDGLARIRGYVGRSSVFPTWMHAARALAESNADVYRAWKFEDRLAMAKRLYRLNSAGRIVLDYDLRIAEPFRVPGAESAPDMWRVLAALGNAPALVVRGGNSDILSEATAARMIETLPDAELLTVPGVGHAPTLDEPGVDDAIARLLARAEQEPAGV